MISKYTSIAVLLLSLLPEFYRFLNLLRATITLRPLLFCNEAILQRFLVIESEGVCPANDGSLSFGGVMTMMAGMFGL